MPAAALTAIFVTSFGVGFTGALMPGPLTTVAVRESVQRGFWAGPLLAFVLASGRRMMSGFVYRATLVFCGLFLLGLGAYFLASGLAFVS